MSALPKIGTGQLAVHEGVRRSSEVRSTLDFDVTHGRESHRGSNKHRPSSFMSLTDSLPSIHDSRESQRRKSRSRSLDPGAIEESHRNPKKRRENDNRSKSHDPHVTNSPRTIRSHLSGSDELGDIQEHESENGRKVRFNDESMVVDVVKPNETTENVNSDSKLVADVKQYKSNRHENSNKNQNLSNVLANYDRGRWPESPDIKKAQYDIFHAKPNNEESDKAGVIVDVNRQNNANKPNRNLHQKEGVHVYSKKYQVKNWTETHSDPGPDKTQSIRRNFRKQDEAEFIQVFGSKNLTAQRVVPPIGDKVWRDRSLHITEISIGEKDEKGFPRPVESIEIFNKQKSVHFDEFIYIRSIDSDHVVKGRRFDPRKPRFPRQQENVPPRHDARPRGADRERRVQSNKEKEATDGEVTARTISSAPSKDREAPVPQINTFMTKEKRDKSEKDATNRQTLNAEKAKQDLDKTKEKDIVITETKHNNVATLEKDVKNKLQSGGNKNAVEKPKVSTQDEEGTPENTNMEDPIIRTSDTGRIKNIKIRKLSMRSQELFDDIVHFEEKITSMKVKISVRRGEPKENIQRTSQSGNQDGPNTLVQARSDKHLSKRSDPKTTKLPDDDHGPAFSPTITESPIVSHKEDIVNTLANKEQPRADVPPLNLQNQAKTPTEKNFNMRVINAGDMQLSSVSPAKSDKSRAVTDSTAISPFTDNSDKSKKKREVTIIDPKDLKINAEEIADETFLKEYEYAHNETRRSKDFEDMDEEEKVDFFKHQYRMRPEQIRELTFHPKVNEPKLIHKTYTGIDTVDWIVAPDSARSKSGRRPKSRHKNTYKKVSVIPTYQRKDFMLSRLQGKVYRHISKVYGSSPRDNREKQFYEKLTQIQLEDYRRRYEMLAHNEKKRLESLFRQREQLKQLRKKFEKDAWKRFMTQYVTSKVVESEYSNRKDYGLPNSLGNDLNSKRRNPNIEPPKERVNKRRFEKLFNFSTGPDMKVGGKPLRFEGFDSVYIDTEDESGQPIKQRQDVRQLIKEAKLLLKQPETDTEESTKPRVRIDYGSRQPGKPIIDTRNRSERPRHHRSRERKHTESDIIPRGRSKSRSKTEQTPKTIKDVILRRQSFPASRYKTSEFWSGTKPKPFQISSDSNNTVINNRGQEAKVPDSKVSEKSEHKVSEKVFETHTIPQKEVHTNAKVQNDIRDTQQSNNVTVSKSVKETVVVKETQHKPSTTHAVSSVDNQKSKEDNVRQRQDHKPHLYLEETETLIGTSRDYDVKSPIKLIEETQHDTNLKSESPVSRVIENKRPASNASIFLTAPEPEADETVGMSRGDLRVSIHNQNEMQLNSEKLKSDKQKQIPPKRTASIASVRSKQGAPLHQTNKHDTHVSSSKQDLKSRSNTPKPQAKQVSPYRSSSRTSIQMSNSLSHNNDNSQKRESKTSSHLTNVVDKVLETQNDNTMAPSDNGSHRSSVTKRHETKEPNNSVRQDNVSEKSVEKQIKANKEKLHNGVSPTNYKNATITSSLASLKPETKQDNKSDAKHTDVSPTVKKTVHISETVEVRTKTDHSKAKHNSNDNEKRNQKPLVLENGLDVHDKTNQNKHSNPTQRISTADNKVNNSVHSTKTDVKKSSQPNKNMKPDTDNHTTLNGNAKYFDTKMNREQFETRRKSPSRARSERKGSLSSERDTLKSRENKGPKSKQGKGTKHSKERKATTPPRKRGNKTRFPDIDKNDKTISRSKNAPKTQIRRESRVEETETETVRTLTPEEKQGAGKWRDLVQKYMREPSPVIGETEDRSVLQTRIESEEDTESETDIFERARRRYALDVDDDDDTDDD